MIAIENVSCYGFGEAIRGMRNPMNSWSKSDSGFGCIVDDKPSFCDKCTFSSPHMCGRTLSYVVGENDLKLMRQLSQAGDDHGKFIRMIVVYADITAPLYWWKEADTYKVGTVANSCSTMHKIQAKEFTLDDFSHENLEPWNREILKVTISALNTARKEFNEGYRRMGVHVDKGDKRAWWQMIQMLPSSYNQRRTVMLNYAVLKHMYHARKNHKLDEWNQLCSWMRLLPYSELITGEWNDD